MKALVMAGMILVLVGCANTGMHYGASGGGTSGATGTSGTMHPQDKSNYYGPRDDIFNPWVSG